MVIAVEGFQVFVKKNHGHRVSTVRALTTIRCIKAVPFCTVLVGAVPFTAVLVTMATGFSAVPYCDDTCSGFLKT